MSNNSFWITLAQLAPIVTATVATIAAVVAIGAIWHQGVIARRRASIDFFFKTEMDKASIDLYKNFQNTIPHMESIPEKPTIPKPGGDYEKYQDVRAFLNICELIACGVNENAFSNRVSKSYWGNVLPESYELALPLIKQIRETMSEGRSNTYCELEKLRNNWAKSK